MIQPHRSGRRERQSLAEQIIAVRIGPRIVSWVAGERCVLWDRLGERRRGSPAVFVIQEQGRWPLRRRMAVRGGMEIAARLAYTCQRGIITRLRDGSRSMKSLSMGEDVKTFSSIHRIFSLLHPASASRPPLNLHGEGSDCERVRG